jgi:hypothetical protein
MEFMKALPFILFVTLVGCSRQAPTNVALQMSEQLQQWIPKGTPVAAARQIMEQHQFACTIGSYDSRAAMPSGSDPKWWDDGSYITSGGKTLSVTNVTILTCKRADTTNDVWAYDATLTAVDGEFDGTYLVSANRAR